MRQLENLRLIYRSVHALLVVIAIALCSLSTLAHASKSRVLIELEVGSSSEPTHVCVISNHAKRDHAERPNSWTVGEFRKFEVHEACKDEDQAGPGALCDVIMGLRNEKTEFEADCHDGSQQDAFGCLVKLGVELDAYKIHDEHVVSCVQNGAWQDAEVRVAVFNLSTQLDDHIQIGVEDLSLTGSVLEFLVDIDVDAAVSVLEVVTGHYLKGAKSALSVKRPNKLQIRPRCQWVTFALPPLVLPAHGSTPTPAPVHALTRGRSVASPDDDWSKCVRGDLQDASIDVLIPADVTETEKVLQITIPKPLEFPKDAKSKPEQPESRNAIVLTASWKGSLPGSAPRLRAKQFVVTWVVEECLYVPDRECPDATIEETGEKCTPLLTNTDQGYCYYSCGAATNFQDRENPLHVRFRENGGGSKDADEWKLELRFLNQMLHGYVDAGDRDIQVSFPTKQSRNQGAVAGVARVELEYVDGQGNMITRGRRRPGVVDTPGVVCGASIHYEYLGDRDYRAGEAPIRSGKLVLVSPSRLARVTYLYVHAAGVGQFQSRPMLRGPDSDGILTPGLDLEGGLAFWPRKVDWRIEVRTGAMVNSVDAYPLSTTGARLKVPYIRFQLGVGFQSPWFGKVGGSIPILSLGAGVYIITGRPFRQRDAVAYFDPQWGRFDGGGRATVDARIRMPFSLQSAFWRRVELVVRVSMVFGEDSPRVETDHRGEPTLDLRDGQALWTLGGAGLAVSL